jgi:solute carrier family 25 (mitochondrial aspartate/glutamate transporter), member 12/13
MATVPTISTVKEQVMESLLGKEEAGVNMSAQTRARFSTNAKRDEETGELVMTEEEFINAIAPKDEDYVSHSLCGSIAAV